MCCCPLVFFLSAKSDKGCYIVTDLLLVYLLQMEKGEVQPKMKMVYRSINTKSKRKIISECLRYIVYLNVPSTITGRNIVIVYCLIMYDVITRSNISFST